MADFLTSKKPIDDIEMDTVVIFPDEAAERFLLWMQDMCKQEKYIEPEVFMQARGITRYKALPAPKGPL